MFGEENLKKIKKVDAGTIYNTGVNAMITNLAILAAF
jgi:hypothetical protein